MDVVITGAGGFLGRRLAALLAAPGAPLPVASLLLVDLTPPPAPRARPGLRLRCEASDLSAPAEPERLVRAAHVLFHFAAVVSGHAEADLDLGLRVNFDATRALAEAARHHNRALRLVFASTVGVFGGSPPPPVTDDAPTTPLSSYGAAKAMSELLLCDYSRRGLVDAVCVRLPTVTVRGGAANRAVTSFASGIVREPLAGAECVVPVPPEQELWVTSPRAAVRNLARAAGVAGAALGARRVVNLPGLRVSARGMRDALRRAAGEAAAARVRFEPDEFIAGLVASFPSCGDNSRALALGFEVDESFDEIVRNYMQEKAEEELEGGTENDVNVNMD